MPIIAPPNRLRQEENQYSAVCISLHRARFRANTGNCTRVQMAETGQFSHAGGGARLRRREADAITCSSTKFRPCRGLWLRVHSFSDSEADPWGLRAGRHRRIANWGWYCSAANAPWNRRGEHGRISDDVPTFFRACLMPYICPSPPNSPSPPRPSATLRSATAGRRSLSRPAGDARRRGHRDPRRRQRDAADQWNLQARFSGGQTDRRGGLHASGNWSSYPPHKHDVHNPPGEVDLEEFYYYQIDRPEGFAIQKVYTADRRIGRNPYGSRRRDGAGSGGLSPDGGGARL